MQQSRWAKPKQAEMSDEQATFFNKMEKYAMSRVTLNRHLLSSLIMSSCHEKLKPEVVICSIHGSWWSLNICNTVNLWTFFHSALRIYLLIIKTKEILQTLASLSMQMCSSLSKMITDLFLVKFLVSPESQEIDHLVEFATSLLFPLHSGKLASVETSLHVSLCLSTNKHGDLQTWFTTMWHQDWARLKVGTALYVRLINH